MPERTKPGVNTEPSQSLFQRWFGSSPMTPEMQQGIDIAKRERPDLSSVQSYGPISRVLSPNAQGYTSPGGGIYLNPAQLQGMQPQDVADTIIHEQTHADQMKQRGLGPTMEFLHQMFGSNEPYNRRPDEMAAFQAEKQRRAQMGRTQTSVPSFTSGQFYVPQDTYLRNESGVKTGPTSSMLNKKGI